MNMISDHHWYIVLNNYVCIYISVAADTCAVYSKARYSSSVTSNNNNNTSHYFIYNAERERESTPPTVNVLV